MLRGLYAADVRTRRPGWPSDSGLDELLASHEMDFACVPDIHYQPLSKVAEGKHVVTELRITGTNTGPTVLGDFGKALLGADVEEVPPTNRTDRPSRGVRPRGSRRRPCRGRAPVLGVARVPRSDRRHRLGETTGSWEFETPPGLRVASSWQVAVSNGVLRADRDTDRIAPSRADSERGVHSRPPSPRHRTQEVAGSSPASSIRWMSQVRTTGTSSERLFSPPSPPHAGTPADGAADTSLA